MPHKIFKPFGLWSALVILLTLLTGACTSKAALEEPISSGADAVGEPAVMESSPASPEGARADSADSAGEMAGISTDDTGSPPATDGSGDESGAIAPQVSGDVVWIQQRLKDLGYYSGPVDGDAGGATRQAIKDYQSDQGLVVTGQPTSELQDFIWRNDG